MPIVETLSYEVGTILANRKEAWLNCPSTSWVSHKSSIKYLSTISSPVVFLYMLGNRLSKLYNPSTSTDLYLPFSVFK